MFAYLPLTLLIYYIVPRKGRNIFLFFINLLFYGWGEPKLIVLMLINIAVNYIGGYLVDKFKDDTKKRKLVLILTCVIDIGTLAVFKYTGMIVETVNMLPFLNLPTPQISLPIGISFYTFQTMSYVIDVYQKKYEPETNIFRLALFTAYLPQLLQGPIGRYDRLAPQLFEPHDFNLKNIEYGAQRIAWGLAKKLILADRAYVFSKAVFADLNTYSGMYVIVALLTFSIYEYCDFSGGIDVVIGVSELFGIRLDENFRQPYFSKSIGEFWRRWHITLGTWMKDYIFYPFSISKKMLAFGKKAKKIFGKKTGKILPICAANLLIFFVVGVWHGAAWKYIIYGLYNGLIIAASNLLKPYYAKWAAVCHVNMESRGWKIFQIFRTFILVNIGWLFDACATATTAFYAMRAVFINFKISILTDGSLYKLGLVKRDWTILIVATIILFISSVMKEKGMSLRDFVAERPLVVRWAVYLILIFATAPFGYVSSSTEFMYAQF